MDSPTLRQIRNNRSELYKSPSNRGRMAAEYTSDSNNNQSPSWRSVYKKRCFDEFKRSRQKLVNRFRTMNVCDKDQKTAKDYLEQELEKICLLEATTKPELKISVDEAVEIYRQIQMELIPTGEFNDKELLEILRQEDMNELMNQETISNNSSLFVVCPLCQKSNLIDDNDLIYCKSHSKCNFKIDKTEINCNLNELSDRLTNALSSHDCSAVPYFQFKSNIAAGSPDANLLAQMSGSSRSCFLLMSCDKCIFMQFIF